MLQEILRNVDYEVSHLLQLIYDVHIVYTGLVVFVAGFNVLYLFITKVISLMA
jgi:hypothetical protein